MVPALISLAAEVGAPLIRDILAKKIGAQNAKLTTDVLGLVARRAGVPTEGLGALAESNPDAVKAAIAKTESMAPEMISLYAAGLEGQFSLLKAEMKQPVWTWAWRPLAMYGFGVLWFWNVIIIHIANAYWKIALPQTDLWMLFQLNSVYMALYMGGHTLKNFAATRWGAGK